MDEVKTALKRVAWVCLVGSSSGLLCVLKEHDSAKVVTCFMVLFVTMGFAGVAALTALIKKQ